MNDKDKFFDGETKLCLAVLVLIVALSFLFLVFSAVKRASRNACANACIETTKDPISCAAACNLRSSSVNETKTGAILSMKDQHESYLHKEYVVNSAINMGPDLTLSTGRDQTKIHFPVIFLIFFIFILMVFHPFSR